MQEIELKFLVPEYKVDALMRQANIKSSQTNQLAAYYFDTAKQDLAKSGIALRIRKEGEDWVQTIKATGDGMAARLEHNHTLDNQQAQLAADEQTLSPDLQIYNDSDLADILAHFDLETLADELIQQYVTDVERITRLVKKEGNVIEVAYDEGLVHHGEDDSIQQTIHEIEFELLQGSPEYLFEVAKTWCKRYKLCVSTVTKAERGSLLLANKEFTDAVKSDLDQLDISKKMSQPAFMRAVVHNCMLQILPNASAIAAGSPDGNHVHQLRVGIRRLRTALKFFDGFSEQVNSDWIPVLKQTFSLLGEYRDREILQIKTQPMLEEQGAPHVDWTPERDALKVQPIDAVRANDFQLTLLELIEFTMSDPSSEANADKLAKPKLCKILNKLFAKIAKASEHFAELDLEEQHDVRKRLKSLRYISEFVAPMFKKKKTKKFLKYLEPAQDILGEYNDSLVGHEFYQQKTEQDANAWFAVGYFGAEQEHAAKECGNSLKTVKNAPTFW
ncbi:CYTH and CHAD domain-containing protein [Psychrobacter sp. I-STPA10]|uniref:CYTH and CHAD domain-containing protein n=1 Tax=Psychrobacter sp. I-STPA10 TaxID=2585769 RepID=UPI001E5F7C14|nr:CYTH and CHAD domain-containing protein [Psychrobacter sp. I-STPA10]